MTYAVEAWYSYKERISHEKKKTIIGLCWAIGMSMYEINR